MYLCRDMEDETDDKQYVLKRLKNPNRIERFAREIEILSRLDHPNVAKVLDFDLESDPSYFVMPYYLGGSLAEAEPYRDRAIPELLDLFGQVCDGVAAVHEAGVLHRDLKPENVFLDTDRHGDAVVGDFGLCLVQDEPRLTGTSEAVGPRYYMAPEIEDGRSDDCTERSDIYSLGKVLYWLLSSGRVFSREKHRDKSFDLTDLTQNVYIEHVNAELLDKMIVEAPEDRFASVREFRHAIAEVRRLMVDEYNAIPGPGEPISDRVPARCRHCGKGSYQTYNPNQSQAFRSSLGEEWITVVCNYCGHIQTFRPDLARKAKKPWTCKAGHDGHYSCFRCGVPAVPFGESVCENCSAANDPSN